MFILDFFLGGLMDQFIDWVYSQLVGFFGNFFAEMGNMGVELFEMSWVQSIVLFFSYLAWALYGVGLVVAVFEVGIEYQTGRASVKDAAINAIKGFLAVGCFTLVPVELYKLSVTLQASLTSGGCPALVAGDKCITIDNTLCVGCGLCEQLCKFDAIKE